MHDCQSLANSCAYRNEFTSIMNLWPMAAQTYETRPCFEDAELMRSLVSAVHGTRDSIVHAGRTTIGTCQGDSRTLSVTEPGSLFVTIPIVARGGLAPRVRMQARWLLQPHTQNKLQETHKTQYTMNRRHFTIHTHKTPKQINEHDTQSTKRRHTHTQHELTHTIRTTRRQAQRPHANSTL